MTHSALADPLVRCLPEGATRDNEALAHPSSRHRTWRR